MDKKLACVSVINGIFDIPNADRIQVATLKDSGWKVIVRKGEFQTGDLCCYIQIDTILPFNPWTDFLKNKKEPTKPIRLRTVKMKGQISQGLALPISNIPQLKDMELIEGQDLTDILGIVHYEKPIPVNLRGQVRCDFPSSFIPKTDEINIKSIPVVLDEIRGREVYITEKCDGTSATFVNIDGDVHVCSRNLSLKETEGNAYWKAYRKYGIDKIFEQKKDIGLQCEICGSGIQKNPLGLTEPEIFVFNIYDVKAGRYLDYMEVVAFCQIHNLPMVPILKVCMFDFTLEQIEEMAKGKYKSGKNREGIVIRTTTESYSPTIDEKYGMRGRMSFKSLNSDYLLEED